MNVVYQTVEDRGNPEEVKLNAPFFCKSKSAWLGEGFYFWDSFIENAHWWGRVHLKKNDYIICRANIIMNPQNCFDLVGNTEHLLLLKKVRDELKSNSLINNKTTLARILSFIRNEKELFIWSAIRINTPGAKSKRYNKNEIIPLSNKTSNAVFENIPAIQICIYNLAKLSLKNLEIVFPEEYIEGYAV